jgi:hypothetical protein
MTEEQIALARRAVACRGWRWMPGMAVRSRLGDCRVAAASSALSFVGSYRREVKSRPYASSGWAHLEHTQGGVAGFEDTMPIPDLTDPATLGCLLALVREAFKNDDRLWGGRVEVHQDSRRLFVVVCPEHDHNEFLYHRWIASGESEVEALVAALEAAP